MTVSHYQFFMSLIPSEMSESKSGCKEMSSLK